ncbi:MAG: leucyl aminopeptidase family protein [Coxiellaceae bacterium]|nr:leucyl aminopeptidase family protein [Coxiellaceae bacterium]
MLNCFSTDDSHLVSLYPLTEEAYKAWLTKQDDITQQWAKTLADTISIGQCITFPNAKGEVASAVVIIDADDLITFGVGASSLPEGQYAIDGEFSAEQLNLMALAWGLSAYQFNAYQKKPEYKAQLYLPAAVDADTLDKQLSSYYLVQDLISTPTEDMGPAELAEAVNYVADEFDAQCEVIIGDDLLAENYPLVHAVGRASINQPRLVDLRWKSKTAVKQKITLVGKGVCYDTGGLSIKPSGSMKSMKKDMGGAAHALGLARLIMACDLPVELRLLIPAVENSVGSASIRPGDVLTARNGLTVEVDNTDAEGRLVLADALAEAVTEKPDLLLDFATLTGAARVAFGPEVHAMMTNDDQLAHDVMSSGQQVQDVVWQMPLFQPYKRFIKSTIADCNNINTSGVGFAGAITAGLFLQQFVDGNRWAHFDIFGWNNDARPGRPAGAMVHAIRAVYDYLVLKS